MAAGAQDTARLLLMVERLIDAEVLLPEEAEPLRAAADAAGRALEAGDAAGARRHMARFTRLTEALVRAGALPADHAGPVLQAAGRVLHPQADAQP